MFAGQIEEPAVCAEKDVSGQRLECLDAPGEVLSDLGIVLVVDQLGTVLKDWTPAEMDKFARAEGATWSKLIRDNNITMAE